MTLVNRIERGGNPLLCLRMGIDIWEVIAAASAKPFDFHPFFRAGAGRHCIPVDPFYFSWKAREYDFHTRFIELAGEINTASVTSQAVNLQLSGHSHGGQVRFPLLGAVYLPPLARKYPCGLNQIGRLKLYTNRGLGTIFVPARFGCPPEITLLTLRSELA